ncbi:MAG: hypothetical protein OEY49_19715 [Candidatus Heimdallarchaeota archaeon]|nr:hypothetical protein [Candidatus Heimdallarchaeota archaeon]
MVVLLILSITSNSIYGQNAVKDEVSYRILYDEAHSQYFTTDLMKTAFSRLNTTFDTIEKDVTIELFSNYELFNSTNVQGISLIIISNPGYDNGSQPEIGDEESIALNHYAQIGGSLLYLSNPQTRDANITGLSTKLNELMIEKVTMRMETYAGRENDTSLIIDDYNNDGNYSHVIITEDYFSDLFLFRELNNITEAENPTLLYYGGSTNRIKLFEQHGALQYYANTSTSAYVIDPDYEVSDEFLQKSPFWFYGNDLEDNKGRVGLVGSTIMFSDLSYDDNSNWIDQASNLLFFENLLAWLLKLTPLPEIEQILENTFGFFVLNNFLIGVGTGLVFFVLYTLYNVKNGKFKLNELLAVKMSTSRLNKKDQSDEAKSKSKKKSKKRKLT